MKITRTVIAEQFDGSAEMVAKYGLASSPYNPGYCLEWEDGEMMIQSVDVAIGDWLVDDDLPDYVFGPAYQVYEDKTFRKRYEVIKDEK